MFGKITRTIEMVEYRLVLKTVKGEETRVFERKGMFPKCRMSRKKLQEYYNAHINEVDEGLDSIAVLDYEETGYTEENVYEMDMVDFVNTACVRSYGEA